MIIIGTFVLLIAFGVVFYIGMRYDRASKKRREEVLRMQIELKKLELEHEEKMFLNAVYDFYKSFTRSNL